MTRTRQLFAAFGLVALVATAGACGSDDKADDTTTTTTEATGSDTDAKESAATIRFDKAIQEELAAVGCHPGAADGVIGPKTDAAKTPSHDGREYPSDGELHFELHGPGHEA